MISPEETSHDASVADKGKSADEILRLALDIAEHILQNGGEITRVENTGYALGAVHVESFAVTTLITASVRMKDGSYSQQMRRVKNTEINLLRVEELNRISRDICSGAIDMETAHSRVAAVKHYCCLMKDSVFRRILDMMVNWRSAKRCLKTNAHAL